MFEHISRTVLGSALSLIVVFANVGCGDSGGSGGGGGNGGTSTGGTSGGTDTGGTGGTGGVEDTPEFAVLVRGTLFTADLAEAKAKHDEIAGGGEAQAKAAGDIAHDALLGTTLLGTQENQYLAIDRWNDAAAMKAFYEDPNIQMAFGQLFSPPPSLETFQRQPTWHTWGDMESGDAFDPYYFVVVRGHLKESDPAKAQAVHDMVAGGGQDAANAAGDVAHIVFTGLADPQEFFAVDIWKSADNIEAVYNNPDLQMAFAALYDAPPTLSVYASTDWHQW